MIQALPERAPIAAGAHKDFDQLAGLARRVLGVPIAAVSLVDRGCHLFPGAVGLDPELMRTRTIPLTHSVCGHVVAAAEPLVISDVRATPLLADHAGVAEFGIVAYAGMPLFDADDVAVGSLCAIDLEPRDWRAEEIDTLADLAAACSAQIALRTTSERYAASAERTRIAAELQDTVVRRVFAVSLALCATRTQLMADPNPAVDRALAAAIEDLDKVVAELRATLFRQGDAGRTIDLLS